MAIKKGARTGWRSLVWSVAIAISTIASSCPTSAAKAAEQQVEPLPPTETTTSPSLPTVWQVASPEAAQQTWNIILNSPLGIAALNQLAIEGFISPVCEKTVYTHQEYGEFQTLLQVKCPTQRGVSTARSYDEMRVTFNRFEDSIENFSIERIYAEN